MANPFGLSFASGAVPIRSADEYPRRDRLEAGKTLNERLKQTAESQQAA